MQFDNQLTASRIALELGVLPDDQAWYLVVADRPGEVVAELAEALKARGMALAHLQPGAPEDLLHAASGLTVVTQGASWDGRVWEALDQLRTQVLAAWPRLVWVAEPAEAERLVHHAPNLAAFFSPRVGVWSSEPVVEEAPRSAAAPFFDGGLPRPSRPPPPGSYAEQAAHYPGDHWLLFEDDRLIASAERLVELRQQARVDGRKYFVIHRAALP